MMDDPKIEDAKAGPTDKNHLHHCVYNNLKWTYFDVFLG